MIETLALFAVCLLGGIEISRAPWGALELPGFIRVLFVGVVLCTALTTMGVRGL